MMTLLNYKYENCKIDDDQIRDLSVYENLEVLTFSTPTKLKQWLENETKKCIGQVTIENEFLSDCFCIHTRTKNGTKQYVLMCMDYEKKFEIIVDLEAIKNRDFNTYKVITYYQEYHQKQSLEVYKDKFSEKYNTLNLFFVNKKHSIYEENIIYKKKLFNNYDYYLEEVEKLNNLNIFIDYYDKIEFIGLEENSFKDGKDYILCYGINFDEYGFIDTKDLLFHFDITNPEITDYEEEFFNLCNEYDI